MDKQLKNILIATIILGVVMLLTSLVYLKSPSIFWGVFSGCVLAIANLVFLAKIVVKILNKNYKRTLVIVLFFILKVAFIVLVLWMSFGLFKVNTRAFAAGYLNLIIAMTGVQILGYKKTKLIQ